MKKPIPYGIVCLVFLLITGSTLYFLQIDLSNPSSTSSFNNKNLQPFDKPVERAAYEFNMLKDPTTGLIPDGVHNQEMLQAKAIQERQGMYRTMATNIYSYQGPGNMGGRTRTVCYDTRFNGVNNQIILAGGISGGVFKSIDNGVSWNRKSQLNQLFSVTSIAQDTRPGFQDTWYYSTGEALGNSASLAGTMYLGNGIYKSTDNGETWTRLVNSNSTTLESFNARQDLISKVIVDPTNGDVYFAALDGIYRSQDGGLNWGQVLSSGNAGANSGMLTDIVCTSSAPVRFYASFAGTSNTTPTNIPGVWTSTTGSSASWTKIAGETATSNHANWDINGSFGRVVLALAPSNENILFALYDNKSVDPAIEAELFKWDQSIGSWVDLSANLPNELCGTGCNDPFAVQGGYNLVIAVKPNDVNTVFIGGTNIYRSTDGFTSTTNYKRIGGYASAGSYALYANSHSDIHSIVFQPGNASITICGNDGGIQRTSNNLAGTVAWTDISNNYRTYQYYYVALDPRSGNTKVMGGAQDNGTTRNIGGSGNDFERNYSGDGVAVGLSNVIGSTTFEYVGSQSGNVARRNSIDALTSGTIIRPNAATDNGLFITLFKLDNDNTENIYYASDSSLYRNTSASTANTVNWTKLTGVQSTIIDGGPTKTQITALSTSRGNYNAASASIFIGTNEGRLYRLDDPVNCAASTTPVNITGAGFSAGGYISSIAVNPRNDDTVMVTFSNYNVPSVWWTGNANAASPNWVNIEGALTLPSYRSSAITISGNSVEYFAGTSVGLYKASVDGTSPATTNWLQEGAADIGNAVISSLAYRPVDGKLLVGTHGYGMWTTTINQAVLPVTLLTFEGALTNNKAVLKWTTSEEQDVKNYEIEKSISLDGFYKIGKIVTAGNSTAKKQYEFIDQHTSEINYYRLKINDNNGDSKYSNVVVIRNNTLVQQVYLLNNPVTNEINLRFSKKFSKLSLQLFNASGQQVAEKQVENATQVNWPLPAKFSKGLYILKIYADGKMSTNKIMKN